MIIISNSVEETMALGEQIGRLLSKGDCVTLDGDLGAGKTHLTKAIAKGLEIEEDITSPTFTIVQEYEGRIPLAHFDWYRIASEEELYDMGYEDYLRKHGALVIEWANNIPTALPKDRLELTLAYTALDNQREIVLHGIGQQALSILEKLKGIRE